MIQHHDIETGIFRRRQRRDGGGQSLGTERLQSEHRSAEAPHLVIIRFCSVFCGICRGGQIRTADLRIMRPSL